MRAIESYVRATLPEPYTILGLRLKAFCLGHYFLMRRFDCAFSDDNPEGRGGVADLLLGLCICSRTYQEFLEFIEDPGAFEGWLNHWGREVKRAIKRDKHFNMFEKFLSFRRYMNEGTQVPKYWEGDNSGEAASSGAHWSQSVLLVLTGELGYSQNEALNLPLSKALADYFKFAERNGLVTLMSDEEVSLIEAREKEISGKR
jgi:hypothetical protein